MGVLKWVVILGFLSVLGLSYMFCKNQNLRLADQTQTLRKKLDRIERQNTTLALDLEMLKSPLVLERRLRQMRSSLVLLSDPMMQPHIAHMEGQSTRMRLAPTGTEVPVEIDIDSHHVTASDAQ
jgi:hypothetical protein